MQARKKFAIINAIPQLKSLRCAEIGGPLTAHRVDAVSCGAEFTACTTEAGELFTWGSGLFGQLGTGDTESRQRPTKVEGGALAQGPSIRDVSCGIFHALAVDEAGALYSWGDGSAGQLGTGASKDELEPVVVAGEVAGRRVVGVSAGSEHSACVTADGALFTWGSGARGKLGHGHVEDELLPRRVLGTLEGKCVVGVECASEHTMCVTDDGKVYTFGRGGPHLGQVKSAIGKYLACGVLCLWGQARLA